MKQRLPFVIAAATFLFGCSEEQPSELSALNVRLVDYRRDDTRLPGVACSFEQPGVERLDATSDADGWVVFDGIDWSLGDASLVCVPGDAYALLALGEDDVFDGSIRFFMTERDATEDVTLSGALLNRAADDSSIFVQTTTGTTSSVSTEASYSLSVPPVDSFLLLGTEYRQTIGPQELTREILQWATSEVLGLAHDTVMDFDLQMSVASQRAASTLMLPADPDSLLVGADAVPDALVTSSRHFENPSVGAGIASSYQGPRASFEIEWIEGAIPDHEVITVYGLFSNPGAERAGSILQIEGYPGEGDITQTFLDHPSLVAPLDTVPFAGAVIEWSGEGEPAESLRICGASRCFFALWPDETTEVRLPSLPVELFDDAEVTGWLYAEDGRLTDDSRDRRYAWRSMTFVP